MRLELVADYLVMAAWLGVSEVSSASSGRRRAAELDAPALAEGLAQRLRALARIRKAGEHLMSRPRIGAISSPGENRQPSRRRAISYHANLYDLLAAYARQAQRHALARVRFKAREVWSLAEARQALARLVGARPTGRPSMIFCRGVRRSAMRRSARASTFAASLELAREGKMEMRQEKGLCADLAASDGLDPGEERAA